MLSLTPAQSEQAKRLRDEGLNLDDLAAMFGVARSTIRRYVDSAALAKARVDNRLRKRDWRLNNPMTNTTGRASPADVAARLSEIPVDTRTPAQRLMGEPVFERSALGQKQRVCP